MKTINKQTRSIASLSFAENIVMGKGTILGYRGYTIWSKQTKKGLWHIFYRASFSTVNFRLIHPFQEEKFGLRVAQIVIDSKIGYVGPAVA